MKDQSAPPPSNQPPAPTPEQEIQGLRAQHAVDAQIIWNLVRKFCPDEHQIVCSIIADDPLWNLAYLQVDAENSEPTQVRLAAGALQPISEQEKKKVVRALRGTSRQLHELVMELGLPHPPSYVEQQIKAHCVWLPTAPDKLTKDGPKGAWVNPNSTADEGDAPDNVVPFPKS